MRPTDPGIAAVLAYDGLCTFEYGIAIELFDLDRPELGVPWYNCRIVGVDGPEARGTGGVRVRELHSVIDTVERVEIMRDLRLGVFDVLVGINLLREGL
ncbi:MAG: hypothetical protein WCK28_02845, partial [Burkholderiales bacterium]